MFTFPTDFPKDVTTWSPEQVFEYFNSNSDRKEHAKFLWDGKISGEDLLDLEMNDLNAYGLILSQAKRLMKCINKLKKQQSSGNNDSEA